MPCTRPLAAYKSPDGVKFNSKGAYTDLARQKGLYDPLGFELPCGKCISCRKTKRRDWAVRIAHEAQLHDRNAFGTLTYDDDHLPKRGELVLEHGQAAIRALRYRGARFRYFLVGEYGPQTLRPHYHVAFLGEDFSWNAKPAPPSQSGYAQYSSGVLQDSWHHGSSTLGSLEPAACSYLATYTLKKQFGAQAENAYQRIDHNTGECWTVRPEFSTMSRRPGLARGWFNRHWRETYRHDSIIWHDREERPPKYYDRCLLLDHPKVAEKVAQRRLEALRSTSNWRDHHHQLTQRKVKDEIAERRAALFTKEAVGI